GNRLGTFIEIKHLDGYPSVVAHVEERRGYWAEVHFSEAGPLQIFVIGMEIREMRPRFLNDLGDRFLLRGHGFHVENNLQAGAMKLLHETHRFFRRINEIRFLKRQRLQADRNATLPST